MAIETMIDPADLDDDEEFLVDPVEADDRAGRVTLEAETPEANIAFLFRVDLKVLARSLTDHCGREMIEVNAAAWLCQRDGRERSPFTPTDEPSTFYSREHPSTWLQSNELIEVESVPLLWRVGRGRLYVDHIRTLVAVHNADAEARTGCSSTIIRRRDDAPV